MRDAFVNTLLSLAKKDRNIELVTGDLGFGVLKPFWEQCPDQFTNAGIAEQNMMSMAAGMALSGKTVFTYSIGNFPTLRCVEQIRNDCAYHNANVKIVCVGGGFAYGALGMSHHATEDIAIMRALPNVTVVCPGDLTEAIEATKAIANYSGTVYLRLGRGGEKRVHDSINDFHIGQAIKIHEPTHKKAIALFSTGTILDEAIRACEMLENKGIGVEQYSFPTVKPLDKDTIINCSYDHLALVTLEEHNLAGGFGSAVSEALVDAGRSAKLIRIGINDDYCSIVGNQIYLREHYKIDAINVYDRIEKEMKF